MHEANTRTLADVLTEFPAERILWARTPGDQVAVTHRGETTIYDSPQHLADAMREHDRDYRGLIDQARDAAAWAENCKQLATDSERRAKATLALAKAQLEQATARNRHALLAMLISLAIAAGASAAALFVLVR